MKNNLVCMMICAVFLGACAKESNSNGPSPGSAVKPKGIDKEGWCTQESIEAINGIVDNIILYDQTKNPQYYSVVSSNCDKLNDLLGARTCIAYSEKTKEEKAWGMTNYKDICEEAKAGLQ